MQTTAPTRSRWTARFLAPLALTALLGAGACSSDEPEDATDVATLGDDGSDAGAEDAEDDDGSGGGQGGRGPDPELQDAMLEFAECMREQGIDMPDPRFDGDGGGMVIMGPGDQDDPLTDADLTEMEAAQEVCQPILDEVEESIPEPDPEQIQEMQDRALAFAECMREHGIDMPDPVFGEGGRVTQAIGGPDGGGPDPNDEEFQEAQEACGGEGGFGISVEGPAGDDEDEG